MSAAGPTGPAQTNAPYVDGVVFRDTNADGAVYAINDAILFSVGE